MTKRTNDLATLAFTAPLVAGARTAQIMSGTMSAPEFTRMYVEKPMAFATGMAAMQMEAAMATMAAMGNPLFRRRSAGAVWAAGMAPIAKAVRANGKRLAPAGKPARARRKPG